MKLLIMQSSQLSRTSSLSNSFNVRDQASQTCKTVGKITVLYIVIFIFLESKLGLGNLILILAQTVQSRQTFIKALE